MNINITSARRPAWRRRAAISAVNLSPDQSHPSHTICPYSLSGRGQNGPEAAQGHARDPPRRFSAPSYLSISPNVPFARPMCRRAARIPPPVPPLGPRAECPSHTRVTRDPSEFSNFTFPGATAPMGRAAAMALPWPVTSYASMAVTTAVRRHPAKSGGPRKARHRAG